LVIPFLDVLWSWTLIALIREGVFGKILDVADVAKAYEIV